MLKSYSAEAVILKRSNVGESDKLVTIYSKSQGKLTLRAPGIRKIHSKKAPHLELFSQVKLFAVKGKTFDIITDAATIEAFSNLKSELSKVAYAYRMVEEIDRLCPDSQQNEEIYRLLVETLCKLDKCQTIDLNIILSDFSLKVLWELGYLPINKVLQGNMLTQFIENIIERSLKSNTLLTKLHDIYV